MAALRHHGTGEGSGWGHTGKVTLMTDQPPERVRLREEMDARRAELGKTWKAVAQDGGIGKVSTIRRVRIGTSVIQADTRKGLEDGLGWAPGSVSAILSGGPPTPLDPPRGARADAPRDPAGRSRNLWVTLPGGQPVMVPVPWSRIPGLEDTTEAERAALAGPMLDAVIDAVMDVLHTEGEKRKARKEEGLTGS